MKQLIAALCLWLPAHAQAATWVPVAQCGDLENLRAYSYDSTSIRQDGAGRSVEIRGDYSKHRASRAREGRMLWSIDCAARTFSERARTEYGQGGQVIEKFATPTPTMNVKSDSVADKVLAVVCA